MHPIWKWRNRKLFSVIEKSQETRRTASSFIREGKLPQYNFIAEFAETFSVIALKVSEDILRKRGAAKGIPPSYVERKIAKAKQQGLSKEK